MRRQARLPLARFGAVLVTMIAVAGVVFAAVHASAQNTQSVTIQLKAENGSSVSGTAVLTAEKNQTKVEIQVQNADGGRPAGIHQGTCDNLNPQATFPLETVQSNGKSTTTVSTSLDSLLSGQYVVNLRESSTQLGVYVACGQITTAAAPTPTPSPTATATPSPTPAAPAANTTGASGTTSGVTSGAPVGAVTSGAPAGAVTSQQPVAAGGLLAVNTPPTTGAGITALRSASMTVVLLTALLAAACAAAGVVMRRRAR